MTPTICTVICGDDIVVLPETCDDGNKGGCTTDCQDKPS